MIISLTGYGFVGKDSLADVFVAEHEFHQYAWADTLRLAASALNPIVGWDETGYGPIRYNDAIAEVGYIEAKIKYPELREILQRLGTEVGRNLIGDNVWVDATFARIERECGLDADIVITDTRFPNEADAVRHRGGHVVRIDRPGVGPVNDHPSETSMEDYRFDQYIVNDGTLDDLAVTANHLLDFLRNSSVELASS